MTISVDTGRLGQEAGTLGSQGSSLEQAREALGSGTAIAIGNCGTVNDDGLKGALQRLSEAWGFEVAAIGNDIVTTSGVMNALAQAYSQLDTQSANAIDSGGG
jgi:hypothetical protein